MIDLTTIKYFLEFYKQGSLLKASSSLHISQPSLSRAMKRLEDDLNLALFNRKENKLTINENGEKLKPYFENLMMVENSIISYAENLRNENCTIRIGLTAPGPLFVINTKFNKKNHRLQIEYLPEEKIIERIKIGVLDIGFINNPINDEKIVSRKFVDEQLYASLSPTHSLAKIKEGIYFKDLDGQSFLIGNTVGIWNDIVRKHLTNSHFYIQDMDALAEVVSSSSLPAFVTNLSMDFKNEMERVYIPIIDKEAKLSFYLVCLKKEEKEIRECITL